jgi:uncharacterized protein (TIGR02118 family)
MIRLTYVLRRLPNLSLEEFQRYWHDVHGPLVASFSTTMGLSRYVQVHTINDPILKTAREARNMVEPYDGVAELWWDDTESLADSGASEEGQEVSQRLLEDERNFIDFSRSSLWFATDVPQVNPTPENIVASEQSSLVKLYYVYHRLSNLSREEAHLYWRMNHGPLIRSWASTMRILRYIQVHTLDDALADDVRALRGKMEDIYDGHAELWYDRSDLAATADIPENQRAAQAAAEDEAKFIDFSRSSFWLGKEHVFVDR